MQDFRNPKVWRKSHDLALAVYRATADYPESERYGLVRQLRSAAVSLESNIAEGSSRGADSDFRRFLFMAPGSLSEVECQLILSKDLPILAPELFERLRARIVEIRRMLWPLVERLTAASK